MDNQAKMIFDTHPAVQTLYKVGREYWIKKTTADSQAELQGLKVETIERKPKPTAVDAKAVDKPKSDK